MKDEGQCQELCRECRYPDCSYYNFIKSENRCVLWELPNKDCISIGGSKQPSLLECLGMYGLWLLLSVYININLDTLLDFFDLITGCENKLECPGSAGCQNGVCTRKSHLPISFFFFKTNNINNQFLNDYICVIFSYWNSGLHLGAMEWMVDVQ